MSNQPSYATDEECQELRNQLIKSGRIRPASSDAVFTPRPTDVLLPEAHRPKRTNASEIPEEGSYDVRPIRTQVEYDRRRLTYLYMLQSVLRTREQMSESRKRKQQ
jgi:hypothetical protein